MVEFTFLRFQRWRLGLGGCGRGSVKGIMKLIMRIITIEHSLRFGGNYGSVVAASLSLPRPLFTSLAFTLLPSSHRFGANARPASSNVSWLGRTVSARGSVCGRGVVHGVVHGFVHINRYNEQERTQARECRRPASSRRSPSCAGLSLHIYPPGVTPLLFTYSSPVFIPSDPSPNPLF
jgi:hypothetical protein